MSGTQVTPELLLRFNGYIHNIGPGALDSRGSRQAPNVSPETTEEVEHAREKEEGLPQKTEEELASPPMEVFQRLFTTNAGNPVKSEEYLERPHEDASSGAEMFYVNADGHHHWHLQRVAKYSLWNATKTAEVAPAQKVGFCLDDSEHVETGIGPSTPVYADNVPPYRDFCQQYRPNATGVYEGISPGWRDRYTSNLGFQWVDASNVLPGEYWLREDVNPTGVVKEVGGENTPSYETSPTIIPGFDAQAQAASTHTGEPTTLTLSSKAWSDSDTPKYAIVSGPTHGTLSPVVGNQVTYTSTAGYTGPDSFTFAASDPNSEFPRSPAVATVSIDVGQAQAPSVAIGGAQSSMVAGTSLQLSALVENDSSRVTWSASAGAITSGGLYTAPAAPPADGTVVVTANAGAVEASVTIMILPVPASQSEPAAIPSAESATRTPPAAGSKTIQTYPQRPPAVYRPEAMLIGRRLIMSTKVTKAGHIRLSAYIGHRLLGTCVAKTLPGRTFTCRLTLGPDIRLHSRLSIVASLRIGSKVLSSWRPAARVAQMKMKMSGPSVRAASAAASTGKLAPASMAGMASWQAWCSPGPVPRGAL